MTRWLLMRGAEVLREIEADAPPPSPGPTVRWVDAAAPAEAPEPTDIGNPISPPPAPPADGLPDKPPPGLTRWALLRDGAVLRLADAATMPALPPGPALEWVDAATLAAPEPPAPPPAPEPPPPPAPPPAPAPAPVPVPRWAYVWQGAILATQNATEAPLGDEGGTWLPCPDECTAAWTVTEAGAFLPPGTVPAVPASVTNAHARAVLLGMPGPDGVGTLFDAVEAALRQEGGVAWQFWEYANEFTRSGALLNSVAARFGLSEGDLDRLFVLAASIEA